MALKPLLFLASSLVLLSIPITVNAQMVDCTGQDQFAYPSIASALAVATPNSVITVEAGPCNENVSLQSQQGLYLGAFWGQSIAINGGINIQNSQSLFLYGLNVTNPSGNGIVVSGSRNVTLENCTSSGNSGIGLQVQGLSEVYIASNGAFNNNTGGGIRLTDNSFLQLVAWGGPIDISYNAVSGLYAERSTFTGVGNTTISNTASGWGIDLRGGATASMGPVFGPNLIQNNPMGGVSLQEGAEISFWNFGGPLNTIQSNGPFGVKASFGSQVTFYDGTQISDHTGPGIDIYANSQVYLWGHNQISRNGTSSDQRSAGIRIDGNSELFMRSGDVSQNNGPAMLALVNSSLDFTGVNFSGNTGGIATCDSTATMISDLAQPNLTPPAGVRCRSPHMLGNRRFLDSRPSIPDVSRLKELEAKYKQLARKR